MDNTDLKERILKQLNDYEKLVAFIQKRSRELVSDFPAIDRDLDVYEYLWAITSSLEGVRLANDDMHRFADFLIRELGWSAEESIRRYNASKEKQQWKQIGTNE